MITVAIARARARARTVTAVVVAAVAVADVAKEVLRGPVRGLPKMLEAAVMKRYLDRRRATEKNGCV